MLKHIERIQAINFIRPNAKYVLRGDDIELWEDSSKEPNENEIQEGWIAYQADAAAKKAAAEAKLVALGLTTDDLKALGLG